MNAPTRQDAEHAHALEVLGAESMADFHERLGRSCVSEGFYYRDGKRVEVGKKSPLRDLQITEFAIEQTPIADAFVAEARERMGSDEWDRLNEEWNDE